MVAVAHIANSLGTGGAEKFVFELALRQAADGHSATMICFERPDELAHGGELAAIRADALEQAGVPVDYLGQRQRQNLPVAAVKLRRMLSRFDPQMVHCHLLRASAALALSGNRRPALFTHQNTPLHVGRRLFRLMTHGIGLFVALSESGATVLRGLTEGPIVIVPNGIDLSRFAPAKGPRPSRPFTLLSVGDLREQKNYPYLIDIAAALRDARPDLPVAFRIAGDGRAGDELQRMTALIAERSLGDRVHLLGSRRDVPDLMRAADAYLLTSDYEGMPLALIEAMASGLPVVSTDVGACGELVRHGETGYLVPQGDAAAVAGRLLMLADDEDLRRAMAAKAVEHSRKWSIEASHQGYLAAYEKLLA